jgi:glucosamine-6-phosphate deaminase
LKIKEKTGPLKEFLVDKLKIKVFSDRALLGEAVALDSGVVIKELQNQKKALSLMFAAAPSQNEFLSAFIKNDEIEWNKINGFHMDEFIGLDINHPSSFANYLYRHIFSKVNFREVFYINGKCADAVAECSRYAGLLKNHPLDIVFLGIGENGHIAFNDPHIADFNDPEYVKIVELDSIALQQQVNDGHFKTLEEVPKQAVTVTIPALTDAEYGFIAVPGKLKAEIIKKVLEGPISEEYPGSIMRRHNNCILYLDSDSAALLNI